MKNLLLLLLFSFLCTYAEACTGYVVAFKGLNDAFDVKAFNVYVERLGYCSKTFSWQESKKALKYINQLNKPYQLYGFSKGAGTISYVLRHVISKPEFVITIGAYRTTNVDFTPYKVNFVNFFDESGKGQKSPGIYLDVKHFEMQNEVNKINGGLSGLGPARS